MGRNIRPVRLMTAKIGKEKRNKRQKAEDAFNVGRASLVPPDELSERAKNKYEQICNDCFWLDSGSSDAVTAYAFAYDRFLDLVEIMKDQPETVMNEDGKFIKNPNRIALTAYVNMMVQLSSKIGLYSTDRLKLAAESEKKEANKFAEFISVV